MKLNNKGQVLIETLVTAILIVSILIYVFLQLKGIANNYSKTSHYNTVKAIYSLDSFREFLLKDNYYGSDNLGNTKGLKSFYINGKNPNYEYLDITNCCAGNTCLQGGENSIIDVAYCQNLLVRLNIKQIIMTDNNIDTLIAKIEANDSTVADDKINRNFKDYIKKQIGENDHTLFRLFIETKDNDFANIKIK